MGRTVRAWLRMVPVTGGYPAPTSQAVYQTFSDLIDVALPTHGGWLNADGSWTRPAAWINNAWALALPGLASTAGHDYIPVLNPGHGTDGANLMAVLDSNQAVWEASTDQVVTLATTSFDSPWDGVVYDAIGFTREDAPDYVELHQDYMTMLSEKVRAAGLQFGVSYRGLLPEYWTADLDLGVIADIADTFEYYFVRYRAQPKSIGPYWWIEREIRKALNAGMSPSQLYLGIPNFAAYYPDGTGEDLAEYHAITYTQAMNMLRACDCSRVWIERNGVGQVREWRAKQDDWVIWISDGDTIRPRLTLVDRYKLAGMMLFCVGMGSSSAWQAISSWVQWGRRDSNPLLQMLGITTAEATSSCCA